MLKKIVQIFSTILIILVVFILFSNLWIIGSTRNLVYNSVDLRAEISTVMLLGTSNKTIDGHDNPFFYERIKTAAGLFKSGIVQKIILSGDHRTRYYNEPLAMRKALIKSGVPDSVLISDGGGIRTLDSVVRCKKMLKINEVIIVTQRFHAYRALFISKYYKLNAIVVVTDPIEFPRNIAVLIRESFARPLAIIDLYLLHRQPDLEEVSTI